MCGSKASFGYGKGGSSCAIFFLRLVLNPMKQIPLLSQK
jgi:hypothetical protein